ERVSLTSTIGGYNLTDKLADGATLRIGKISLSLSCATVKKGCDTPERPPGAATVEMNNVVFKATNEHWQDCDSNLERIRSFRPIARASTGHQERLRRARSCGHQRLRGALLRPSGVSARRAFTAAIMRLSEARDHQRFRGGALAAAISVSRARCCSGHQKASHEARFCNEGSGGPRDRHVSGCCVPWGAFWAEDDTQAGWWAAAQMLEWESLSLNVITRDGQLTRVVERAAGLARVVLEKVWGSMFRLGMEIDLDLWECTCLPMSLDVMQALASLLARLRGGFAGPARPRKQSSGSGKFRGDAPAAFPEPETGPRRCSSLSQPRHFLFRLTLNHLLLRIRESKLFEIEILLRDITYWCVSITPPSTPVFWRWRRFAIILVRSPNSGMCASRP
ncbi:hypothetical protein CYMTET_52539, partial [Cymbomonas tetramitiformis]